MLKSCLLGRIARENFVGQDSKVFKKKNVMSRDIYVCAPKIWAFYHKSANFQIQIAKSRTKINAGWNFYVAIFMSSSKFLKKILIWWIVCSDLSCLVSIAVIRFVQICVDRFRENVSHRIEKKMSELCVKSKRYVYVFALHARPKFKNRPSIETVCHDNCTPFESDSSRCTATTSKHETINLRTSRVISN